MATDLVGLHRTLVKGIRMIVMIRRLAKDVKLDCPELKSLEMEYRECSVMVFGHIQRLKDGGKPLVLK